MRPFLRKPIILISLVLLTTILACGPSAGTEAPTATPPPETQPPGPPPTTQEPAPATQPPEPRPPVTHLTIPGDPTCLSAYVTDASTLDIADERRSQGDRFDVNIFERPYTSQVMDYLAHLDIVYVELCVRDPWVYATLFLEGEPPGDSRAIYAIEIDTDLDERGDWMIMGFVPPSIEWTTDGVRAFADTNDDVGGLTPVFSDMSMPQWDGFDQMVFEEGYGDDPDAAWIRRHPEAEDKVQLALKLSLIGNADQFLWGVMAEEGGNTPDWCDFNDHFTETQAGSPVPGDDYPIKDLAAIDSTCRYAYGFVPSGFSSTCASSPTDDDCDPTPGWLWCRWVLRDWVCDCIEECPPGTKCPICEIPCD
ncbi:MAG: hypothetical protein PVJ07_05485 [Anaerolineales bacterium]|jgi:hypothetical protein